MAETPKHTPEANRNNGEITPDRTYALQREAGRLAVGKETEESEPYQYRILQYENDPEKTYRLQRSYLRYTKNMVEHLQEEDTDEVVFLDKSGRPLAWMMQELWDDFADTETGNEETPPMPGIKFANIDREHWRSETGGKEIEGGIIDVSGVPEEIIEKLRSLYLAEAPDESISPYEQPSIFDGKNVTIVDEVEFSGDTLKIASELFQRAFPEANVSSHTWMRSVAAPKGLPDLPVWYNRDNEYGRGIGNRNLDISRQSPSSRQRESWMFLGTRLQEHDPASEALREEVHELAEDYREGKLGPIK